MSGEPLPYVSYCGFCGGGLLRLFRCEKCDGVVATCDECELTWVNLDDAPSGTNSDATFPQCPHCSRDVDWYYLDAVDVADRKLGKFVEGESV